MSTPSPVDPGAAELVELVRKQLEVQPWYKRFSNTATTAAGLALVTIWLVTSAGFDIPSDVTRVVYGVLAVLTVLGVVKTPNGTTEAQVAKLEALAPYVGEHRAAE